MSCFLNNERGPRDTSIFLRSGGTDGHVGPGSHECSISSLLSDSSNIQERYQGSVKRFYQERPPPDVDAARGPGSYDQRVGTIGGGGGSTTQATDAFDRSVDISRSSFRARSAQISPIGLVPGSSEFLPSSVQWNPGPGEYEASRDIRGQQSRRAASAASLPTESLAPERMVAPGPAAYDPIPAKPAARSCDWQSSVCKQRGDFDNAGTPGPGTYGLVGSVWGLDGPNSPFDSLTERPGMESSNAMLVPGPGAYLEDTLPSVGSETDAASTLRSGSVFKSASVRSTFAQGSDQPGPAHYATPGSTFGGDHRRSRSVTGPFSGERDFRGIHNPDQLVRLLDSDGMRLTGFSSKEDRPVLTPAPPQWQLVKTDPGQYNPDDSHGRSLVAAVKSKQGGRFGNGTERFSSKLPEFSVDPGAYQEVVNPTSPIKQAAKAFGAGLGRTPPRSRHEVTKCMWEFQAQRHPDGATVPCPGRYEAVILNQANYRSKAARPWTEHLSFGSGVERPIGSSLESTVVGPGAYDSAAPTLQGGRVKITSGRSSMVPATASASLGPGEYEIAPPSLLRKSHNVSHSGHAKSSLAARAAEVAADAVAAPSRSRAIANATQQAVPEESEESELAHHHAFLVRVLEERAKAPALGGSRHSRAGRQGCAQQDT